MTREEFIERLDRAEKNYLMGAIAADILQHRTFDLLVEYFRVDTKNPDPIVLAVLENEANRNTAEIIKEHG